MAAQSSRASHEQLKRILVAEPGASRGKPRLSLLRILRTVFLPEGYPQSTSSDYMYVAFAVACLTLSFLCLALPLPSYTQQYQQFLSALGYCSGHLLFSRPCHNDRSAAQEPWRRRSQVLCSNRNSRKIRSTNSSASPRPHSFDSATALGATLQFVAPTSGPTSNRRHPLAPFLRALMSTGCVFCFPLTLNLTSFCFQICGS
jgi:hypothetical protein